MFDRTRFLPLFLGCLLATANVAAHATPEPSHKVSWTTSDGVILTGLYQPPQQPNRLVWVLLHGLGSVKEEWVDFVAELSANGDGYLLYDARGHGGSVRRTNGRAVDYHGFRTAGLGSEWGRMVDDLGSAIQYLNTQCKLDPRGIAVGGASLGANVALVYAGRHPEVPGLILLSPGLEYAGVQTPEAFKRYGRRPLFIAASPDDSYAYASVRQLIAQRSDPKCVVAQGEGARHGVQMFTPDFTSRLLSWINGLPRT